MDCSSDLSPSYDPLEQYVLLAKSTKGAAAKDLIERAVAAPGVYVFGELLSSPNIAELANSEDGQGHWKLLNLFAFGNFQDFINERANLPPLTEPMLLKLRQLSLVTVASSDRRIAYSVLLRALQLSNVRQLEDLIIDAIYKGIIQAKLDQQNQCVEVEQCKGRDVQSAQIGEMINTLSDWSAKCQGLLVTIEEQIHRANSKKEVAVKEQQRIEEEFGNIKKTLKATGTRRSSTPDFDESFSSEVSSSRLTHEERKKETKRHKGGLRGSSGRQWLNK